jgi:hypothetical protein
VKPTGAESKATTKWVKAENLPDGFDTIEVHISGSTVVASMSIGSKRVWHGGTISSRKQASPTELNMLVRMKVEVDGVVVNSGLPVMLTLNKFENEQDDTLDYFIEGSSAAESVLISGLKKK